MVWTLGYLPMLTLALEDGLRQRELISLKWNDLDIETGVLTVQINRVMERRAAVHWYSMETERGRFNCQRRWWRSCSSSMKSTRVVNLCLSTQAH